MTRAEYILKECDEAAQEFAAGRYRSDEYYIDEFGSFKRYPDADLKAKVQVVCFRKDAEEVGRVMAERHPNVRYYFYFHPPPPTLD